MKPKHLRSSCQNRPLAAALASTALASALVSCGTAGSAWMAEPLGNEGWHGGTPEPDPPAGARGPTATGAKQRASRVIAESSVKREAEPGGSLEEERASTITISASGSSSRAGRGVPGGRSLGTFRNTYYDFPSETDFDGPTVAVKNASCETISQVPRTFFESLCVQGSGTLRGGATVSFAKRDCGCAENCPRTDQRICFDVLDAAAFPWGRGAMGKAITPLVTVAVDSEVIPLGTAVYVPELDGLAREPQGNSVHDGCFVAQDRGVRVKGKHIDVFTGHASVTALWNRLVPSNQGVTVILDSPRCVRAK
jgi:3D (Asp-Asp-Asp) domain-containing protein